MIKQGLARTYARARADIGARAMTPIYTTVIKGNAGTADAAQLRAYLDSVIEAAPVLVAYRHALAELATLKGESRIEVYEHPETGNGRVLVLWLPDAKRAVLKAYDAVGDWQWTRASNPQDALRRYRDGRMQA